MGTSFAQTFEHFSLRQAVGMHAAMFSTHKQELLSIFMDSFPIRIRHIYVIHQPRYFSLLWVIAKHFFKKKITSRVHLLGGTLLRLSRLCVCMNAPL